MTNGEQPVNDPNEDGSITNAEEFAAQSKADAADASANGEPVMVSPVNLPPIEPSPPAKMDAAAQDMNLKMIMDIPVDIHVEIGQTRLSIRDILRLGVSSVVELDRLAGQPADIVVNGKMIGQGDVVIVNETFGIRITKLVGVQDRIKSL
jgi:flagellar motor switch protein FliN